MHSILPAFVSVVVAAVIEIEASVRRNDCDFRFRRRIRRIRSSNHHRYYLRKPFRWIGTRERFRWRPFPRPQRLLSTMEDDDVASAAAADVVEVVFCATFSGRLQTQEYIFSRRIYPNFEQFELKRVPFLAAKERKQLSKNYRVPK